MVTITDLPDPTVEHDPDTLDVPKGTPLEELSAPQLGTLLARFRARTDQNFLAVDRGYAQLQQQLETLKKRPPKRARSGSAARVNPDQLEYGYAIAALNGLFIVGAFVLVYAGQYAFASYTQLPEWLWLFIPIALDLPVVSASFTAAIFVKRRQPKYARTNWAVVFGLTVLGSTIQVTHVLDAAGVLADWTALTFPLALMAFTMGLFPWLVMYLSHNLARLLVRPTGEAIEKTPASKRRPAPKKRSTR